MKLVRVGPLGREAPGLVDAAGDIRVLDDQVVDWSGDALDPDSLARLAQRDLAALPKAPPGSRLGVPVHGVGKIIGVGLNYRSHALEAKIPVPAEPIWFLKATSALNGPNDPILRPRGASQVDWEGELGVVIGRRATRVPANAALGYVAGLTLVNDVSERDFQLNRGGQWTKGKSCDSFAPVGPWLVTLDEIPDIGALEITLRVNGVVRQRALVGDMVADVAHLIESISGYMTLEPGDIIATGTPAGVGFAAQPQTFLRAGDVVELSIPGLGLQRQVVADVEDPPCN
jgi:2,4-diketo-3-deoxy-L-fuconate hydrolase